MDSFQRLIKPQVYNWIHGSIHEVILVPESFGLEPERMQEMVKEINQTGVAPEEVLSDSVYYFDGEEIRIVAK